MYRYESYTIYQIQNNAEGKTCNQHVGKLCTKASPATNNSQQEKSRRTKEKMGRWNERGCHRFTWHRGLENYSHR